MPLTSGYGTSWYPTIDAAKASGAMILSILARTNTIPRKNRTANTTYLLRNIIPHQIQVELSMVLSSAKSESRISKFETNPNTQFRNPESCTEFTFFEFRICLGFRYLDSEFIPVHRFRKS